MSERTPSPAPGVPAPAPHEPAPRPAPRPFAPRPGGGRPEGRFAGRRPRRRVCAFCVDKVKRIEYRDVARLRRYLSDRAKIEPRRKNGNCAKHQRMLTTALKRARHMALLPYTAEQVRAQMSPQARALAGGPPPPKPERAPYRSEPQAPPAAPPATPRPPVAGT